MSFKDHFSRQSDIYLLARPTYPHALFDYLTSLAPGNDLCWDCGAGNGQASISLAAHFKKVIATDGSEKQIKNGIAHEHVEYRVTEAEASGLQAHSADLITVATAAHWFNLDKFYAEAQRVAKQKGVLAVWTYSSPIVNEKFDELTEWFSYDLLYDYWPDGRWYVRNKYTTLPFPFEQIKTPDFFCEMHWTREQFLNYIRSWSAYDNYVQKNKRDPIEILMPKLEPLWDANSKKDVKWQLHLKCAVLNNQ